MSLSEGSLYCGEGEEEVSKVWSFTGYWVCSRCGKSEVSSALLISDMLGKGCPYCGHTVSLRFLDNVFVPCCEKIKEGSGDAGE